MTAEERVQQLLGAQMVRIAVLEAEIEKLQAALSRAIGPEKKPQDGSR